MTNTVKTEPGTEEQIFEAAREVFYEQGFDGARMQSIAKRAGINHSMLHYYFRTKGKLFDAVFRRAAMVFMPPVVDVLKSDLPLLDKLDLFVDRYFAMVKANPHMPGFIIQELRRNPAALRQVAGTVVGTVFDGLSREVHAAVESGQLKPTTPEDLLANLFGLCAFPFLAQPMLETIFGMEQSRYEAFLEGRRQTVKTFIKQALVA
ncbi:MAG: TetR/AcrR family transcriptional regulator [Rhodothermales bacterium]|jgi:TetR/AcrR family transcriptional regulator